VLAAHVHPELPWGTVALDPGAVNASSDSVEITVTGEPSHGAYPHLGRDPVLAIAQIVIALHAQAPRRVAPHDAVALNVGVLEGGGAENIIPSRARARASLRAQRPADRLALRQLVEEVVDGVAAAHGCRGTVELVAGEPALENDALIVQRARTLIPDAGMSTAPEWRSCGSDDFAFFGELAPLAMGFVGLRGAPGFETRPAAPPRAAAARRRRQRRRAHAGGALRLGAGRAGAELATVVASEFLGPRNRSFLSLVRGHGRPVGGDELGHRLV